MKHNWMTITVAIALLTACTGFKATAQDTAANSRFTQLYNAAQAAKAAGRFDEAIADLVSLEKINPRVAEVHATLGVLYYQQGDYGRAIVEIKQARMLKPAMPGLDSLLAFSLAEAGREQEALPGLERAFRTSTDPQIKRQAGLELMRAYSHLNMDRKTVETALALRDEYKNDAEVLYNAGKVLGNSAYLTMQMLFHQSNGSLWTHLAEGEALESQNQVQDAIEQYRQVLQMDPHRPNIHYRIGRAYLKQWGTTHAESDLQAAKDAFTQELANNPTNANAAYELAVLYSQSRDYAEAERFYTSATQMYPDFEEAQVGLGGVLIDEQRVTDAIPHLIRATKLRPGDSVAWYRLSRAQQAVGDKDAAKESMAVFRKLQSAQAGFHNQITAAEVTPQKLDTDANVQ